MKKFLLSSLTLAASLLATADEVSFTTFSSVDQTVAPVSFVAAKASGSTAPRTDGTYFRLYAKNTLTVSVAEGYYLEKIVFSTESSNGTFLTGASTNTGTFNASSKTWDCESGNITTQSVTLTNGTVSSGHTRINKITVTYGIASSSRSLATLAWSTEEVTMNVGDEFVAPTLSVTVDGEDNAAAKAAVVYTSSNTSLISIVDGNITLSPEMTGEATVTASIPADNAEFYAKEASFKVSVVDPNKLSEVIDFSTKGYTNQTVISTVEQGVVTLKFDKGSNQNDPKYFTNNKDVRLYGGGSLTISVPAGYVITEIISTYKNEAKTLTATSGTFNSNYTVWTATDKVNTVTFNAESGSGNRSWTAIEVHYAKAGDASKKDVILTFESEVMNVEFEEGKQVQGLVASTNGVEGLTFSYSSSDENVATVDNNGMLTLVGIGSTTITAKTAATDEYNEGMASYTLSVERAYHNFNEIIASATEGEKIDVKFPMTVGYVNGANIFATDNQGGYMLLFMYDNEYAAGDIIPAGMTASYTIYNGLPELKPSTAPAATEKGEYVIETVEAAEVMSQPLNKIVKVMDVNFAAATPADKISFNGTASGLELALRNGMGLASVEAGTYDVTLVIGTYTKDATEVQAPNQLQPIEYVAVPTAPVVMIDGEAVDTDAAFELQGKEVVVYLTAQEGASIWYKFTAANADNSEVAPLAEDGFTEYTAEGITIGENLGTLEYYSELNGRKSAISSLTFQGTPTAINEIEASEGTATEWFDMSGRRVATPSKGGIYVKKTGSKVSKYAF